MLTHFSPSNICDAKKMLVSPFRDQFADGSLLTERRSSQTWPAHEAEVDDILEAFDIRVVNS